MMRKILLPNLEVRVFPDAGALNRAAVDHFLQTGREAIRARGRFMVALSGGSTPKAMYSAIAAEHQHSLEPLDWQRVHVFFGDERLVPGDHADSNYRMASDALLTRVPIPSGNIHRVRTELGASPAAAEYEKEIRTTFETNAAGVPRFDLILLGMGNDGHTASLFPETSALEEKTALVSSNWVEKLNTHRITLTFPLINAAAKVTFLAGGGDKAAMIREVLRPEPTSRAYPAQCVHPSGGELVWMVDEAAAAAV
jgi:6-phosphogluconolactonase